MTIGVPIVTGLPRLYTDSVPTMYQSSKTVKGQSKQQKRPLVYQSSHVYQDCTNSVPIVKNSQNKVKIAKMTIGVPIVTRLYQQCTNRQKQSKESQNSKNDHWCTNRHMSTKTVPTGTNRQNSQKRVKTAKMTIGVPRSTQSPPNTQSLRLPNTQSCVCVTNSTTINHTGMTSSSSIISKQSFENIYCWRNYKESHQTNIM